MSTNILFTREGHMDELRIMPILCVAIMDHVAKPNFSGLGTSVPSGERWGGW